MSPEAIVALLALAGALMGTCFSIGAVYGILKNRVDTNKRDIDQAFRMIRKNQKQENEE